MERLDSVDEMLNRTRRQQTFIMPFDWIIFRRPQPFRIKLPLPHGKNKNPQRQQMGKKPKIL